MTYEWTDCKCIPRHITAAWHPSSVSRYASIVCTVCQIQLYGGLVWYELNIKCIDTCAVTYYCLLLYLICCTVYPLPTLYWKSDLFIPRNETVQPVTNSYIHVSVSDLYISRIILPICLHQNRQTDPRNIYLVHRYMDVEIGREDIIILLWKYTSGGQFHFWL